MRNPFKRRYTPEQHIAMWTDFYIAGKCSLESLEWVIRKTLEDVEESRWP